MILQSYYCRNIARSGSLQRLGWPLCRFPRCVLQTDCRGHRAPMVFPRRAAYRSMLTLDPKSSSSTGAVVNTQSSNIMDLIARAPWREAVTYRDTWPHEYVVIQRDGQQELLAAFCQPILLGEGVEERFFHQSRQYLFLDDYKHWTMTGCADIDPETYDGVLNRALLFKDRRDFIIRQGDTARREEMAPMATQELGNIQEVLIRDLWPRDASDFTPWLAEHLESLGNALGLDLELDEQEASVGSFSPDILARETSDGEMVAIENQLRPTDHGHLGQSITYAAEH